MKLARLYRFKGSHLICAPGNTLERLAFRTPTENMNFMRLRWQQRLAAYARSVSALAEHDVVLSHWRDVSY